MANTYGLSSDRDSGPESQLMLLSRLVTGDFGPETIAHHKRTSDGIIKDEHLGRLNNDGSSSVKAHSRNTSALSATSTVGSRISELSAELKTRLSYAMVKVNHGWQSRSFGEVESLVSQTASPISTAPATAQCLSDSTSSSSTSLPYPLPSSVAITPTTGPTSESIIPCLGPPACIQPAHALSAPVSGWRERTSSSPRNWHIRSTHASEQPPSNPTSASPQTPLQPSSRFPMHGTPFPAPALDSVLYPSSNVREQDAIETLLFMRSPGNSVSLKYSMSPSVSPQTGSPIPPTRRLLPDGPVLPRRSAMSPPSRQRVNNTRRSGTALESRGGEVSPYSDPSRRSSASDKRGFALPIGLGSVPGQSVRPVLADADIERMLDRVARAADADSSGDEDILLPVGRGDGARVASA